MFYFCLKTISRPLTMSSLKDTCFQNNMCAETTLREFAISLVLVISCETVNVETERRNFLTAIIVETHYALKLLLYVIVVSV